MGDKCYTTTSLTPTPLGLSRLTKKSVNRGSNSFRSVRFVFSGFRFGLIYVLQYSNLFAKRYDWFFFFFNDILTNESLRIIVNRVIM